MEVVFETREYSFGATLNESVSAKEIYAFLPIESVVSRWGDEIYFDIGHKASASGSTMDVEVGDIAYWSQGKCMCVFFGVTPASEGAKPVPASPVVVIGTTKAPPHELRRISLGEKIRVRRKDT